MRLFDAHCHMQDEAFDADLDAVLQRARAAGVDMMLCCGTAESDWPKVEALSRRHSVIIPSFGIHPWYSSSRSVDWLRILTELLLADPMAVVGEIGLDHAIDQRNDAAQAELFADQLRLAKAMERPACIHCRKAWESTVNILGDIAELPAGFMLHSFSGPVELIKPLSQMGAYFSFSGTITRHRNTRGHAAVAAVPIERLLVETDAPDLTPVAPALPADQASPGLLARNEPANLVRVIEKIAELRNMDEADVAAVTSANACRLLRVNLSRV
ncbi:MAG: TatD family hydrolase [bacterium]